MFDSLVEIVATAFWWTWNVEFAWLEDLYFSFWYWTFGIYCKVMKLMCLFLFFLQQIDWISFNVWWSDMILVHMVFKVYFLEIHLIFIYQVKLSWNSLLYVHLEDTVVLMHATNVTEETKLIIISRHLGNRLHSSSTW